MLNCCFRAALIRTIGSTAIWLIALVYGIGIVSNGRLYAADERKARPWLKLVLVYDSTLPGAAADLQNFTTTFSEMARIYNLDDASEKQRPPEECILYDDAPTIIDITTPLHSSGPSIEPGELFDRIKNDVVINSPPDTALVFWFKGHGFVDQTGERWLELGHGDKFSVKRDQVKKAVVGLNCRLTVFLTEACTLSSLKSKSLGHFGTVPKEIRGLVDDLFIAPKGVVDISSSTYIRLDNTTIQKMGLPVALPEHVIDEVSWTIPQGGLFSMSLLESLNAGKAPNLNWAKVTTAHLTWEMLSKVVANATDTKYVEWRNQALKEIEANLIGDEALGPLQQHILARQLHQTPQVLSLP
jgi:hypothetical protein